MKRFYDMTKDFVEVEQMLEENPDDETLKDTLEGIQLNLEQKSLNTVALIKNINIPLDSIDQEIKRLTAHKNAIKNKVQRLKALICDWMVETGTDEIKDNLGGKIKLQSAAPGLDVFDVDALPKFLKETKIEIVPDKNQIKYELKQGSVVPGAKLKEPTKFVKFY